MKKDINTLVEDINTIFSDIGNGKPIELPKQKVDKLLDILEEESLKKKQIKTKRNEFNKDLEE